MSNRMVKLARRPRGMVTREDFKIEDGPDGFLAICTFSAKRTNVTPDPISPCV